MRTPDLTRQKILEVAAAEIHVRGFKATSLSDILTSADISKGALYHHFKNKQELGYAVMEEVYMPMFSESWLDACSRPDPIGALIALLKQITQCISDDEMAIGCPMINMCTEMAATDDGFRSRSEKLYEELVAKIAESLPKSGLRTDVDPYRAALFILASMNGIVNIMKGVRCREVLAMLNTELANYIDGLRSEESKQNAQPIESINIEFTTCTSEVFSKLNQN